MQIKCTGHWTTHLGIICVMCACAECLPIPIPLTNPRIYMLQSHPRTVVVSISVLEDRDKHDRFISSSEAGTGAKPRFACLALTVISRTTYHIHFYAQAACRDSTHDTYDVCFRARERVQTTTRRRRHKMGPPQPAQRTAHSSPQQFAQKLCKFCACVCCSPRFSLALLPFPSLRCIYTLYIRFCYAHRIR